MKFITLFLVCSSIVFSGQLEYQQFPPIRSDTVEQTKHSPLHSPEESWEKQRKNNPNYDNNMIIRQMERQTKAQEQFSEDYHTNSIICRTLLFCSVVLSLYLLN
jgi:hypothetical protein